MAFDKEKVEYKLVDKGDGSWQIVAYRWTVDPIAIFTDVNRAQEYIELIDGAREFRIPEPVITSRPEEAKIPESETVEAIKVPVIEGVIAEPLPATPATPVSKKRKSFAVEQRQSWTSEEDVILRKFEHLKPRPFAQIAKELKGRSEKAIKSRYARLLVIDAKSNEKKKPVGAPEPTPAVETPVPVIETPLSVAIGAEGAPKQETIKLEPKREESKVQLQTRVVSAAISSPMALARQPQQLAKTGPESGIEFGSFRPSDDLIKAGR